MPSIDYLDQTQKKGTRALRFEVEKIKKERDHWKQASMAKDKILSTISHDLKGQWGGINGLIHILSLENQGVNSSPSQAYLDLLRKSSASFSLLMENLLQWAKKQSWEIEARLQDENLYELLKEVYELNQLSAQTKGIDFRMDCPEDLWVSTDLDLLSFILRNLAINALKYTSRGKKVTLRARRVAEDMVLVEVEDAGTGIPEEVQSKLFDPEALISSAGTAEEKGTGLGLLLCLEFAQMLGTSLHIDTAPRKGTRFSFFLQTS